MHILIVCVGSAGDVYPFIAIGKALQARGHDVQLAGPASFSDKIARAGLGFIEIISQARQEAAINNPDLWHPRKSTRVLFGGYQGWWADSYEILRKHVRSGETVLVASTLASTARLFEEKFGNDLATVHLSPSCVFSASDPAALASIGWVRFLPVWAVRVLISLLERTIVDPLIAPSLNTFRATLGLVPLRNVSRWAHSPQRVIFAFPEWFATPQSDWPPNSVCTAFPILKAEAGEPLDDDLKSFLDAGPAPIAFTPGSAMAHGRLFFQRAIAATEALGMRAVLVTPYRDQLPTALPSFVHHVVYVPFDILAPRVAAFVHHGGIGTSAKLLAAGKPQLITPFAFDQPDNAARLKKLGVAVSVAPDAPIKKWVRALSDLLSQPTTLQACETLAARMRQEPSAAEQIADWIEALGNKRDKLCVE